MTAISEQHGLKIRQPIVTVAGHVDHGKTSILDAFRSTSVQAGESGGITQKISFTKFPIEQIKKSCPLLDSQNISVELPGILLIDTPGHAAFTHLRKRGGALADLAIVVVAIKEGIKPQTVEVLQILKQNKVPFVVALNKVDTISGWQRRESVKESIEAQAINVRQEFDEALLTFQGALHEHGFESELFYEISDFKKKVAIVPCSARTHEGIPELLMVLCGLSQKFLKERLALGAEGKGVILEMIKDKTKSCPEAILYDGTLKEGDEIAIASFSGEPVVSKIRCIEEILPLSDKYKFSGEVLAATGVRLHLTNKESILPGMPFQKISGNLEKIKKEFKKEVSEVIKLDKTGIAVKADSLGSLEALLTMLRQENFKVLRAGIGDINKNDLIAAKANLETEGAELDAVILGFNVGLDSEIKESIGKVKILLDPVIYKLIENLQKWRKETSEKLERERMLSLATICKLEILHKYIFRNSNPAVFGVRVLAGELRAGIPLIAENGESIARVKGLQKDKESVSNAAEGEELAISLPGVNFERKLGDKKYLYVDINVSQFKKFKENKDLLSSKELNVLDEVARIKKMIV